jgi:hypothetical protein
MERGEWRHETALKTTARLRAAQRRRATACCWAGDWLNDEPVPDCSAQNGHLNEHLSPQARWIAPRTLQVGGVRNMRSWCALVLDLKLAAINLPRWNAMIVRIESIG